MNKLIFYFFICIFIVNIKADPILRAIKNGKIRQVKYLLENKKTISHDYKNFLLKQANKSITINKAFKTKRNFKSLFKGIIGLALCKRSWDIYNLSSNPDPLLITGQAFCIKLIHDNLINIQNHEEIPIKTQHITFSLSNSFSLMSALTGSVGLYYIYKCLAGTEEKKLYINALAVKCIINEIKTD